MAAMLLAASASAITPHGFSTAVTRAMATDVAPAARLMRSVFVPHLSAAYSVYHAERVYADGLSARLPLVWVARARAAAGGASELVGACECSALEADIWHMSGLCVSPAARRRGVGAALVAAVRRDALRARRQLFLHVEDANADARRLYASAGFELVAEPLPPHLHALRARAARSVDPSGPAEVLYVDAAGFGAGAGGGGRRAAAGSVEDFERKHRPAWRPVPTVPARRTKRR
ncbi:hypothetical protein KFE25_000382 [Diacronema lutheri]|uniref:N-acetyltransferase domain-containing protein n=1 Tax=Diacronema lutheri TaxID=2081491 RepID=A0A8J5XE49_DIALT|nr:hypothetical protein KFE25_000382 [Diacronema lutheri]